MGLRWMMVVGALALGCGPVVAVDDSGVDDGSSSGHGDAGSTVSTSATSAPSTTSPSTTSPGTTSAPGMTTATTDPTDPSTISTTDPTGDGVPDGEVCQFDDECSSGHCYVQGILGGVCGECSSDADCEDGGCTPPNPIASPPVPSFCNDGEYGAGCMSDAACQYYLECAAVFTVPGVLTVSTCSICGEDTQCVGGDLCAPEIDVTALTGAYRCVEPGSLADGQSCAFETSGDASCASGHCAGADVMGLFQLGVCSGCEVDADCVAPQQCAPPQVDLEAGLIPGSCQ